MVPRSPRLYDFPARPFTVAEARAHGVGERRLRARDLAAPFPGIRVAAVDAPLDVVGRCRALVPRLPSGAAVSHASAAELHRLPVPSRRRSGNIHTIVPPPHRAIRMRGVVGHECPLDPDELTHVDGIPVTTVVRTWLDLADRMTVAELVATGDHIIHHELPLATREELARAVAGRRSRRGIRSLRSALDLLDDLAESPRESLLRVLLIEAGLPRPKTQHEIFDGQGRFVARVDLAYPEQRIAIEYEGDHHRTDKNQWRKDIVRVRRLHALGWTVLRVTLADLDNPVLFLREVRSLVS
jgi:very-short-patch-repair endonuclease